MVCFRRNKSRGPVPSKLRLTYHVKCSSSKRVDVKCMFQLILSFCTIKFNTTPNLLVNVTEKLAKIFFRFLLKLPEVVLLFFNRNLKLKKNQDFFNFSFNVFNISRIISKTFITLAITSGILKRIYFVMAKG